MRKRLNRRPSQSQWTLWVLFYPYLILVSTATTGGGGLFSSRRTFFHREHGRYCFRKVYSENITHKITYTPNKKLDTPTKKPSKPTKIPSRQTKRFSMISKTLIMPRKKQVRQHNIKYDNQNTKYANQNTKYANQKFTLFCREAIFVANLRTFLAYFLEAKKYGGVPKRTNIRYVWMLGSESEQQSTPQSNTWDVMLFYFSTSRLICDCREVEK